MSIVGNRKTKHTGQRAKRGRTSTLRQKEGQKPLITSPYLSQKQKEIGDFHAQGDGSNDTNIGEDSVVSRNDAKRQAERVQHLPPLVAHTGFILCAPTAAPTYSSCTGVISWGGKYNLYITICMLFRDNILAWKLVPMVIARRIPGRWADISVIVCRAIDLQECPIHEEGECGLQMKYRNHFGILVHVKWGVIVLCCIHNA